MFKLTMEIEAEAVILGLHRWARNVRNHASLYRFHALQKKNKAREPNLLRREDAEQAPCQPIVPELTHPEDKIAQAMMLVWGPDDKMCAAKLRYILKNKRGPAFQNNLVDSIKDQLARLQENYLIDKLDEYMEEPVIAKKSKDGQPKPKRTKRPKNESMQLYKKRRLEDQPQEAQDLRKLLLLPAEKFPR